MKIFIDSADLLEIKQAADTGLVDGVTTNPILIAGIGNPISETIQQICSIIEGPVSAEVNSIDFDEMIEEALKLTKIAKHVVIKLPCTLEGFKACRHLTNIGIQTNLTLCFQPLQALIAAKCGATYISPFIGRIEDNGASGLKLIKQIRKIYNNFGFSTKILSASIRTVMHVLDCALAGSDVVTISPKIFRQLFNHVLTDKGLVEFLNAGKI